MNSERDEKIKEALTEASKIVMKEMDEFIKDKPIAHITRHYNEVNVLMFAAQLAVLPVSNNDDAYLVSLPATLPKEWVEFLQTALGTRDPIDVGTVIGKIIRAAVDDITKIKPVEDHFSFYSDKMEIVKKTLSSIAKNALKDVAN